MPLHPQFDLTRPTEATRRAVYDRVAELVWTPDPQDEHQRTDTPDEGGLTVFHVFGHWLAFWTNRDEPELPEHQRRAPWQDPAAIVARHLCEAK